jgi:predicted regulator of Ras-like GTPase activity (Roadblock/LC7/MglB family)
MLPAPDGPSDSPRSRALQLRSLMAVEGFVGCAIADLRSGALMVGESHERGFDLPRAARILADTMRANQEASVALGCLEPLEEIVLCAGEDQFVARPLAPATNLFIFAKLDHAHANLTLARMKLAEAQFALS